MTDVALDRRSFLLASGTAAALCAWPAGALGGVLGGRSDFQAVTAYCAGSDVWTDLSGGALATTLQQGVRFTSSAAGGRARIDTFVNLVIAGASIGAGSEITRLGLDVDFTPRPLEGQVRRFRALWVRDGDSGIPMVRCTVPAHVLGGVRVVVKARVVDDEDTPEPREFPVELPPVRGVHAVGLVRPGASRWAACVLVGMTAMATPRLSAEEVQRV